MALHEALHPLHDALSDTIKGAATGSGIVAFNLIEEIPHWLSTIGLICATILAVHGVYELIMKYYRDYKERKNGQNIS